MISLEANTPQWWALSVETNGEEKAVNQIKCALERESVNHELFHPRRIMLEYRKGCFRLVKKCLYPGYSFLRCQREVLSILLSHKPSGFYSILKLDGNIHPVYDEEIENIKSLVDRDGTVGISKGMMRGAIFHITAGPLTGREAQICHVSRRKHRVKVETTIGNKRIRMELACLID